MNSYKFSICLADSICAVALDMLPDGNENSYHIEFVGQGLAPAGKTYRFYESKNIEQTKFAYRQRFASKTYISQLINAEKCREEGI